MSFADGKGYSITDWYVLSGHGEQAGSASAIAFATRDAKWVKFKAAIDNAGNAYIGLSGVTKAAGTTTTTAGWPLDAGQETDWLPAPGGNLSAFYIICDNAGDDVLYQILV